MRRWSALCLLSLLTLSLGSGWSLAAGGGGDPELTKEAEAKLREVIYRQGNKQFNTTEVPEEIKKEIEKLHLDELTHLFESMPKAHSWDELKEPGLFGRPSDLVDLGIWTLAVFILLLVVLGRFAWKPMLQGLQSREETIKKARDEALAASEEAKKLREELKAEMAKANDTVQKMIEEARSDAEKLKADIESKAQAEAQANRERALREIETAKDQALHEIVTTSADLAAKISSKAIRRELSPDDHRQLVDEALEELKMAKA